MTIIVNGLGELKDRVGQHLGYSDWLGVAQERINTFADATSDHQWIHVDLERSRSGPFGGPIAHGYQYGRQCAGLQAGGEGGRT